MNLTREEALRLHRWMWNDMKEALGDYPTDDERIKFKGEWCEEHFPNEEIYAHCFLCEYAKQVAQTDCGICHFCPIFWDTEKGKCQSVRKTNPTIKGESAYLVEPISWILSLKEREVNE